MLSIGLKHFCYVILYVFDSLYSAIYIRIFKTCTLGCLWLCIGLEKLSIFNLIDSFFNLVYSCRLLGVQVLNFESNTSTWSSTVRKIYFDSNININTNISIKNIILQQYEFIISWERHTCTANMLAIFMNGSVNVTPETYQNLNEKDIFPEVILISLGALLLESLGSHIFIFFSHWPSLEFPPFPSLEFPPFPWIISLTLCCCSLLVRFF